MRKIRDPANNEQRKKIKLLEADLKERKELWLHTIVITTIHHNRESKDN